MKFQCSIIVNQPLDRVVELFANPKYLGEYQDGFVSKQLISGTQGQNGAVSKMLYKDGKREMELTETIVDNQLPEKFEANYHHKHMDNMMRCYFIPQGDHQTLYETEIEYTAFRGFLPKIMATLFPGMFKRQVQGWLDNFKAFAERT